MDFSALSPNVFCIFKLCFPISCDFLTRRVCHHIKQIDDALHNRKCENHAVRLMVTFQYAVQASLNASHYPSLTKAQIKVSLTDFRDFRSNIERTELYFFCTNVC